MTFLKYISIILFLITALAVIFSCMQEKLLFFPEKLSPDYQFSFEDPFQEVFIPVDKKTQIHGLLFKANSSKGLVFYLHGNAGSNRSWGSIADVYLGNQYDFFIPDYRGYGKSQGKIKSEKQFLRDLQTVYDSLKKHYQEKDIVITGYSIGTGPAAWLAAHNHPKLLILKAPYYNIPDVAHRYFSFIPSFLMRYKFRTDQYLQQVKCPIVMFHGDRDEVIYTGSSYKLKPLLKKDDQLIILKGQSHNGINENGEYRRELKMILGVLTN